MITSISPLDHFSDPQAPSNLHSFVLHPLLSLIVVIAFTVRCLRTETDTNANPREITFLAFVVDLNFALKDLEIINPNLLYQVAMLKYINSPSKWLPLKVSYFAKANLRCTCTNLSRVFQQMRT